MKVAECFIVAIFLIHSILFAEVPADFNNFLRSIDQQSQRFKGSEEHSQLKTSRSSRDYQVGDQEIFWSWALNVMPPEWLLTPATCRAVGEHCYLFVADEEWNVHMSQSEVDEIMPFLEEHTMNSELYGAIEMDTTYFGALPDELDNDPKVIVFYMELGSFAGSTFDGYFSSYNQVTEAEAQTMNPSGHSNECEMIYMTCHPLAPNDPIRISVLSHELQHLIHWGADINESSWVNEGCSELAMVLFGLPDPITSFPNNPDNSLIVWDQQWADYIKTMLFFTYLHEHFNTDGLIYDIVSDPANSISGISNQLVENGYAIPFEAIFANWTIANYLDDPDVDAGQYNYEFLDLPQFTHSAYIGSYPNSGTGSVQPWAADYLRLDTDELEPASTIAMEFISDDACSIALLYYGEDGSFHSLSTFADTDNLEMDLTNWDELFDKIVLVVINNSGSPLSYNYNFEIHSLSSDDHTIDTSLSEITAYPNPVGTNKITFSSENLLAGESIEIFNIRGQKIKELRFTNSYSVEWDKRDKDNDPVSNGIYYYRLKTGKSGNMKKMLIIK
jgi:type IX secretion system substrate protein